MPLQYVRRLSAPERPILRSRRGRAGRLGGPRRPRAPRRCGSARAKAPRSSRRDGAGEAHLLQWAQSMPPAGQARGTLRVLARAREVRGIVPRIRYETVRCVKKRTGALASGAAVLGLYSQPYDARYPVIGRDEQPKPRRARDASPPTTTHTCGAAPAPSWLYVESLDPWRTANATARRTGVDWARPVQALADHPRDRQAKRLIRVCDPLNAHVCASFTGRFRPPKRAAGPGAYSGCLRPGTAIGLHRAEPELRVLTRQALTPRRAPRGRRPTTRPQKASTGGSAPWTPACASNICALQYKYDGVLGVLACTFHGAATQRHPRAS